VIRPEDIAHVIWHARSAPEVLAFLQVTDAGLSEQEVAARSEAFGPNALPGPTRTGALTFYLRQFKSPLAYLLLAAAVVSLAIGEVIDAAFIFLVLQINASIGTIQEVRAASAADALGRLIHQRIVVQRGGRAYQVDAQALVPGDVVQVLSGTLVPADTRLLSEDDLRVDESLLTGESTSVGKDPYLALDESTPLADRRTLLHAGTTVLSGRGVAVVTRTGLRTEVGRIAQAMGRVARPPLVVRLERFTRLVGLLVVAVVGVLAAALHLGGMALEEVFFLSVALAVSAIPEGLPVAITVALAVGSARMARRNVVVRKLPAVEGLRACTVIASDKTGTLTCNELTVSCLWLPGIGDLSVEGRGYTPRGRVTRGGLPLEAPAGAALTRLAVTGALANEADLWDEEGTYRHVGDTVDVAFLALAGKVGLDRGVLRQRCREVDAIPYESARRYAATFNRDDGGLRVHVKGATEQVIAMCAGVDRDAVLAETERLAANGYRVIALAGGVVGEADTSESPSGLELLGLAGLIDPLRPEAAHAVERCRRAGIEVRMVTGDHPTTALAIARDLGLAVERDEVVRGSELLSLASDPGELDLAIGRAVVFARVEPTQKLDIVESLQRAGHFVAVTGDGVNDAPALRAANIGVAMGRSGTDVAREAADLILADDNFESIVNGVEEGRVAYDNVRKVVYLLVSTGAAEIVLFFLAFLAGLPLPLYAAQLLWLNLVTNGIQDVALAFEKGEPHILDLPPRPPRQQIFDRRMIEQVLFSGGFIGIAGFGFFWWALGQGWSEAEARNGLLLLMVCFENVHVFNCRSESRSALRSPLADNPLLSVAVLVAQALHVGAMWTPGLRDVLQVQPVSVDAWMETVVLAAALIGVMELFKRLRPQRS
jgi:magnesium-transporting ATPase (P-type)